MTFAHCVTLSFQLAPAAPTLPMESEQQGLDLAEVSGWEQLKKWLDKLEDLS